MSCIDELQYIHTGGFCVLVWHKKRRNPSSIGRRVDRRNLPFHVPRLARRLIRFFLDWRLFVIIEAAHSSSTHIFRQHYNKRHGRGKSVPESTKTTSMEQQLLLDVVSADGSFRNLSAAALYYCTSKAEWCSLRRWLPMTRPCS